MQQARRSPAAIPALCETVFIRLRARSAQSTAAPPAGAHACVGAFVILGAAVHKEHPEALVAALALADALKPRPCLHWTEWQAVCRVIVGKDPAPCRAVILLALNVLVAGEHVAALQMAGTPGMDTALLLLATDDEFKELAQGAFAARCLVSGQDVGAMKTLPQCILEHLPPPFHAHTKTFPAFVKCIVCLSDAGDAECLWRAMPCGCVLHATCFSKWTAEDNVFFWQRTQCLVCRASLVTTTLATMVR